MLTRIPGALELLLVTRKRGEGILMQIRISGDFEFFDSNYRTWRGDMDANSDSRGIRFFDSIINCGVGAWMQIGFHGNDVF